ncbi:citrate/2-methylcitrate synthase [Dasania sp. GY-MA-18]|uniref:Citrate synthase n=1 Tax=Dasania phycosphaerae TaxID=2950436 RepID=A0A9J6RN09_9GAMM|nr:MULTISPECIES: citrate/2-methylcitrate synthase [Dasania]MCR8923482.1 citrate/2-methylcitrate synthase [Dasania sp. GY-MA-18]MCZ0865915.1 citrate/2-methylcitrate synthase [Dasania phycosphaerae]MCZ0869640.1 citrate/2-methylcitrate synthase [Dasania phycosphaerae]
MSEVKINSGLEGVVVGETKISDVDGVGGQLFYRGYDINYLVTRNFIDVSWMLVFGDWPSSDQHQACNQFLLDNCMLTEEQNNLLMAMPNNIHPMLVLQSFVPTLSPSDMDLSNRPSEDEDACLGLFITAKIAALISSVYRKDNNLDRITALEGNTINERFFYLFHGRLPSDSEITILDCVQILQMEHGFNAGTFAGRVCSSTKAPISSSISASIGTLYGVLHGGADEAALAMAEDIGNLDNVEPYIDKILSQGGRVMGMGHREYKVVDPRAKILKPLAMSHCEDDDAESLLNILIRVEEVCRNRFSEKGKDIWANVEFYKGAVFNSLGIPKKYFTSMFAMSRVYGYVAHFLEFKKNSRLIRPKALYVGKYINSKSNIE